MSRQLPWPGLIALSQKLYHEVVKLKILLARSSLPGLIFEPSVFQGFRGLYQWLILISVYKIIIYVANIH